MDLYFLRHAEAVDIGAAGVTTDAARHLSDAGIARMHAAARGLAWLGVSFDLVLSSPLVRARQTAELAVPGQPIILDDALAGYPPEDLIARLAKLPPASVVLLVGHEPQFSETIERLLGIRHGAGWVTIKKASLALVRVDPRAWPQPPAELEFLLSPKHLRRLGGG